MTCSLTQRLAPLFVLSSMYFWILELSTKSCNIDISKTFICGDIDSPPFLFNSTTNSYQNDSNKFTLFNNNQQYNLPAVNKFSIFMRKKEDGFKPIFIESDKPDTCYYIDIIRNYNTIWGQ